MSSVPGTYSLLAVGAVSLAIVPLHLTCAFLTSESQMPHDSYLRMTHARDGLFSLFLVLQVGAGLLLVNRFRTEKTVIARLLWSVGLSLASAVAVLICGLGLWALAEHSWERLAEELFS